MTTVDTRPLTHETALDDLRAILFAAQKVRSTVGNSIPEYIAADLQPYLFGPKNIVLPLASAIQRSERTGKVRTTDYINFMRIAHSERAIEFGVLAHRGFELRDVDVAEAATILDAGLDDL